MSRPPTRKAEAQLRGNVRSDHGAAIMRKQTPARGSAGTSSASSDERSALLQVRTLARIELIERKIFAQAEHFAVNFSLKIFQQILNLSGCVYVLMSHELPVI